MNANENKNIKELKIPYKFDSRYVFKDSLVRIQRLINEMKSLEELVMNTKLPYIFTNDNIPTTFDYSLKELSSYDSYSEITWLLSNKNIKTPIKLAFNLTENTIDNTVLVVFELSVVKRELVPDEYKHKIITLFEGIAIDILKNMIIKLKKDNKDIYHYQSKIFNYSRDKVLNILNKFHEIMKKNGIVSDVTSNGDLTKEGTIVNFTLANTDKEVKLMIKKYKVKENDIKWIIIYTPLNASFSDSSIEWNLIKLNDNQTLATNTNKYIEKIEPDILKNLTERKFHMFEIIEEELNKKYSQI